MTKREFFEENVNNPELIKALDRIRSNLALDRPRAAWQVLLRESDDDPDRINPDEWINNHQNEITRYRGILELLARLGIAEKVTNTTSSEPLYQLDPSAHVTNSLFMQFQDYLAQRMDERKESPTKTNQRWLIIVSIIAAIIALIAFLY